jgi:hypothetical protein
MPLKPWYKVVTPREDLREGKPLDASEFAVHLDQVREGSAPADYQKPERFFERTYLTKNLASLASHPPPVRRENGNQRHLHPGQPARSRPTTPAECNSAIQQIANLRYEPKARCLAGICQARLAQKG